MYKIAFLLALPLSALAQPKIGNFKSVEPAAQQAATTTLEIPESHTFQKLYQRSLLPLPGSVQVDNFDFTGYIPTNGSSALGTLSINHETSPGGVTLLGLSFDSVDNIWNVTDDRTVDFSEVQNTVRNCSGGVTPWETVVTSEESIDVNDANGDGYFDIGWQVEIDPITGAVVDQDGDGTPDKIWKMGNMSHENFAINNSGTYAYEGADMGSTGFVYKYVLTTPNKLVDGELFVLKLNVDSIEIATSATWEKIPNATPEECNNVLSTAQSLGATNFNGVEDVEVGPDGYIYFTAKGTDRVYRFTESDSTQIEHFEIYIENIPYTIEHENGSADVNFQDPDNLAFDNDGNLFILQDGGNNYIWMTTPEHNSDVPDIHIFANTPNGSEATGMTFSPDGNFMFLSIQHPIQSNINPKIDASGSVVMFNEDITIVIGRKGVLGTEAFTSVQEFSAVPPKMVVLPNPIVGNKMGIKIPAEIHGKAEATIVDASGKVWKNTVLEIIGNQEVIFIEISDLPVGNFIARLRVNDIHYTANFIKN